MREQDTRKTDDRDAGQDAKPPASRPRKKTSRLAIAAVILGVGGLLLVVGALVIPPRDYWEEILAPVGALATMSGLVVGVIALVRIRKSGGRLGGRSLALTGILFSLIFIGGLLYLDQTPCRCARIQSCRSNVREIARATQVWSVRYGGDGAYYPPSMRALYDDGVIEDIEAFFCPASDTEHQPEKIGADFECLLDIIDEKIPVRLVAESLTPLAWDNTANRHGGVYVVYFDQHVEFIGGDDALEQVHREVEEWLNTYETAKQAEAEAEEEQAEESP